MSSSNLPPLPSGPDLQKQMADDLRKIRRKQAIEFYTPGVALLLLIFMAWYFLHG
jgi:hypothetical protein